MRIHLGTALGGLLLATTALAQPPELVVQTGHAAVVFTAALSPDGRYLATGSGDYAVVLWEVSTGAQIRALREHTDNVRAVEFSPDGKSLLTASQDKTARIWDIATGKLLRTFDHPNWVIAAAFSADGTRFLTGGGDNVARLWDAASGAEVRSFTGHTGDVATVAFSPDGKTVATGGVDTTVKLWPIAGGEPRTLSALAPGATRNAMGADEVKGVAYSPDGKLLLASAWNNSTLWNTATGASVSTFGGSYADTAAISPDGKFFVTGHENNAVLRGLTSGEEVRSFTGHTGGVRSVSFSRDGRYLLTSSYDSTARLWEVATGKLVRSFASHANEVVSLAFSPDGRYVAAADKTQQGKASLWELATGKMVRTFATSFIYSVSFSADSRYLVTGGQKSATAIWEVATGKLVRAFPTEESFALASALSPDGKLILRGMGDKAELIDAASGSVLRTFAGHAQYKVVDAVAFSPDGRLALTGSWDATAILWEVATGKQLFKLAGHSNWVRTAVFSPDGKQVLTGSWDGTAKVWSAANGKLVRTIAASPMMLEAAAYSADGKRIVTGGRDKAARIWDAKTGALLQTMSGHSNYVLAVAFGPDGQTVVTGSADATTRVWSAETGKPLATLVSLDETDWATVAGDGYYMASKGAARGAHFVQGLSVYSFDNFDLLFNRPDIVVERLGAAGKPLIESYRQAYRKRLKKIGFTEDQIGLDLHLPEIAFGKSSYPLETKTKMLSFSIKASDSLHPLDRLNVFVNDVPLHGSAGLSLGGKRKVTKQITLELSNGRNKVQVSVLNKKGAESLKQTFEITYQGEAQKPAAYVVVIGVSNYAVKEMSLRYAAKDALDLAKVLEGQQGAYRQIKTLRLTDADATKEKILGARKFLAQAGVDDHVILFAAGHGMLDEKLDWYFGTQDVDFANPAGRGLAYEDLEGLLDGIPARRKLLLMDACNSGEVDKDDGVLVASAAVAGDGAVKSRGFKVLARKSAVGLQNSFELMQELFAGLQKGSGAMVISSASGAEFAWESAEWNNGVFTYAIMEGLKTMKADANGDGRVQVSELRDYVTRQVQTLTNGRQHPTSRKENSEFDFAVY